MEGGWDSFGGLVEEGSVAVLQGSSDEAWAFWRRNVGALEHYNRWDWGVDHLG